MYLKHGLYRFTLVAALFALTACSWIDGYSSTAHQQLLMLQFISDAAAAPLDQRLLSYEDRQIRPLFSLALSDSDALRQSNLHVLEKNYQRLYRRVVPQERALTPFEAGILAQQTEKLYQQAINGEQQRSGR